MLVSQQVTKESVPVDLLVLPPEPDLPDSPGATAVQVGDALINWQADDYTLRNKLTAITEWETGDEQPSQK